MYRTFSFTLICLLLQLSHGDQLLARQFNIKDSIDDVVIYYKWKKPGIFRKDAPLRQIEDQKL